VLTIGASNVMRTKTLHRGIVLACNVLVLASLPALAGDEKDKDKSKPVLSGVWALKEGETSIEFADKRVVKISPHGDDKVIAVVCEYTTGKEGLVKVKITGFEGKDEAKEVVKELLPVGTEFSFKWKVTKDTAKLTELKGDKVDVLKSHLEGEYREKK
jgi:hypothetical protein